MAQNTKKNKSDKKNGLKGYEYPDGISMKKLNFGLWWVKNKKKLKNSLIAFLIIVSLISWGYTIFNWTYYLLVLEEKDDKMVKNMARRTTVPYVYLKSRSARSLSVSSVYAIKSGDKYDLYTIVQNPNKDHWGQISYCFIKGSEEIDCGQEFILPDRRKYILSLARKIGNSARDVKFMVKKTTWIKINPHKIPDWEEFEDQHLDFKVDDMKFVPASEYELSEKINLNLLSFKVKNRTAYDYYEVPFNIILFRGGKVIGVNKYSIKDFRSNQEKEVDINWPGYIGSIGEALIEPNLNITREDIYSP